MSSAKVETTTNTAGQYLWLWNLFSVFNLVDLFNRSMFSRKPNWCSGIDSFNRSMGLISVITALSKRNERQIRFNIIFISATFSFAEKYWIRRKALDTRKVSILILDSGIILYFSDRSLVVSYPLADWKALGSHLDWTVLLTAAYGRVSLDFVDFRLLFLEMSLVGIEKKRCKGNLQIV